MSLNPGEYHIIMFISTPGKAPSDALEPSIMKHDNIYPKGTLVPIRANPITGYRFNRWKIMDAKQSMENYNKRFTYEEYVAGADKRVSTSNPEYILCDGIDENRFNETYRTFWIVGEYEQLTGFAKVANRIASIFRR
jgi:hypothetical protein